MENKEREFSRLFGKISEKYGTMSAFIDRLNRSGCPMTVQTLSRKLNGSNYFNQREIELFCDVLSLKSTEIPYYFFPNMVKNIGHEQEGM